MLRARIAFAVAFTLAASACSGFEEGRARRPHSHRHDHALPSPALPQLESRPLRYYKHLDIDVEHLDYQFAAPPTPGYRRIVQRLLLLHAGDSEPAYLHARDALDRIGIPYDAIDVSQTHIDEWLLIDGAGTCLYNGVIFSTSGLDGQLDAVESARIAAFELECGAREAVWYAWPSPELGLSPTTTGGIQTLTGTVEDPTFFSRVKPTAQIPYRDAWGYPATILDPTKTTALVTDQNGHVVLALHVDNGREILVSTIDGSPYLTHSLALEYDMLRWVTGGMFIGQKRAYLAPQIDDIFLDNDMWQIGIGNIDSADDPDNARLFRINGADIESFLTWQSGLQARLPAGSNYITDMAFNGWGATAEAEYEPTLLTASLAAGTSLTWLNHTWDHENMDQMSYADALAEVMNNCQLASTLSLNEFSCEDLVTPEVSGLRNPDAVLAIIDAGVRYTVSDTSRTEELFPDSPGDNPSFNVGRISALDSRLYQVPRHPTFVFYDVETPAVHIDEYNHLYREYWGRDLTYEEMVDKATDFSFMYLMTGDIDPMMFHQANLHDYGGGRSVFGDFIDATVDKFLALTNVPILTLSQVAIGEAMKARAALNACNALAMVVEDGAARTLHVTSSAGCVVPVTGLDKATHGTVETYNGEKTTSITMPASGGTVSIPL